MIFVGDLGNPEAPVVLADGSLVLVEMHPDRGCLTHISADGKERRIIAKTGRPNGLALDKEGVLWVAESLDPPSLLRVTLDGEVETIFTECKGEPLLFPNDLCFGPDGALYMTDSGYECKVWRHFTPEQKRTTQTDGKVYRVDVAEKTIEKLASGLAFANGIAFGPDSMLYVGATQSGMIYRYAWEDGRLGEREDFAYVKTPEFKDKLGGPDGMAFGMDGDLYVTVVWQGDLTILDPKGNVKERIQLVGSAPTNVAFGLPGSKKIYITEQGIGQVEVYDVVTDGLLLYT